METGLKLARISIIRSKSKNKSVKKRGMLNKVCWKIICFNACSIVNKLTLLHNFLVNNDSIDLIFITESWLTVAILDYMIFPNSYCIVRNDRAVGSGGGVILLYKSNLQVVQFKPVIANECFEYICVDVHTGKSIIRFCCLYLPSVTANSFTDL